MRIDSPTALSSSRIEGSSPKTSLNAAQDKRLKGACQDFEALFLSTILKGMRKTVEKSNLFGSDSAENTFQEMMDDEISKSSAKTSSMGIADMLYRQLTSEAEKQADSSQARNDGGVSPSGVSPGSLAQAAVPPNGNGGDTK